MVFIFFFLLQLKIVQQILFNLYLWQLKEYRLDRLREHINRIYTNKFLAFLGLTLLSPIKLPQKSIKAIFLFILNLILNSLFFLPNNIFFSFLALVLTPSIFLVSLWLIYPFEKILRIVIYVLASRKIKLLQRNNGLTVIGITGSYGKSTTKSFVDQILSLKFKALATPTSVNTPLGISLLALQKLNQSHQFFIVEMGAYKIGEIKELCQIVHPQIGIITGISNQHLALFGSQENIIKAKSELLEALPKNGIAIVNKQSTYLPIIPKEKMLKIIFHTERTYAVNEGATSKKPRRFNLEETIVISPPIPNFLKINLEPALILAKLYNINEKEIKKKLSNLKLPAKTMQELKGYNGAMIIDDSFNSNFEGTISALDYLQKFKDKKIVVMPCLIELGDLSEISHQQIGERIEKTVDLAIITTADYFNQLKQLVKTKKIILSTDPKETIKILEEEIDQKTAILIEGRVHQEIIKRLSSLEDSLYLKSVPQKSIVISLSPNIEEDDITLAKKLFFQPYLHQRNNYLNQLEQKLKEKFGFHNVFLTNSGRSAFYLLLKALNFKPKSEIAIQGFTCNAAVNPILWNNLKPLYIDIDDSWNLNVKDLERKINPKTKMVVIQHSFGIPAEIKEIQVFCQKHNLFLIEDLALSLGAKYNNQYCSSFSDASYLSFGRDKVISSVFGGALVTNNFQITKKIAKVYQTLPYPSIFWTYQQLLHPLITYNVLPIYHLKISRILILLLQKLTILSKAVTNQENRGKMPSFFPKKLPNQLAALAENQLDKLDKFNQHRQKIAQIYQQRLTLPSQKINKNSKPICLRYNVVLNNAQEIIKRLRKERIYLGNWYSKPIDPKQTNLEQFGYQPGICPKAEKIAGKIINLPTHINISERQARLIIKKLKGLSLNKDRP
jgi:UDP-N-acetylmuramoyl-tripeptide--D-alanyl-D-alanine ligase